MVHRSTIDGQIYVAKMTVKEMAQIKEKNPLYSVESLEIKEASRIWNAASISEQMPNDILTAFPQEAFNNIISRLQNNLNKLNEGAKMVHCSTDVADINEKSQSVTDSAFTDAVSQGLRGPALIKNILADFHRKIKKQMYGYPQS